MMAFELKLEKPRKRTAVFCGIIMAISYGFGGLIPMIPYFAINDVQTALHGSIAIAIFVLVVFGYLKAWVGGSSRRARLLSSVQMLLVGVVAAGTSYGIVYGINHAINGGEGVA